MTKLYEDRDLTFFGPVSLTQPSSPLEEPTEEEREDNLKKKLENRQIQKAIHGRRPWGLYMAFS